MPTVKPYDLVVQPPGMALFYELPPEYFGTPADAPIRVSTIRPKNDAFVEHITVRRVTPEERGKRSLNGTVLMIAGGLPGCRYEIQVGDAPPFQFKAHIDGAPA